MHPSWSSTAPTGACLLLATRNPHKVREIRSVLGPRLRLWSLADFPLAPAVVEDADSFAGNARRKAAQLVAWLDEEARRLGPNRPLDYPALVLADDSGLEVDALGGAPGVHSARFAALDTGASGNSTDAANNAKLLRLLCGVAWPQRTARFRCVIALTPVPLPAGPTPADLFAITRLFEGVCSGRIGFEAHGDQGFGYDPLFIPDDRNETFAQLGEAVKNQLSHRARALEKLRSEWLARIGSVAEDR